MNRFLKSVLRPLLPRWIRLQRILGGPLRGYRIVCSWHDYPAAILGRTEAHLLTWLAQNIRPGETWLDVGAHYGYTAIAMCRLTGQQGRIFAFEPMLSTAGYLSQTRRLNKLSQLTIVPMALGASTGLMRLPTVRGMVDSTQPGGNLPETILVTRLDALWPQICEDQKSIHGIKIDVQGMEIDALEGMATLLKEYQPKLVVELHAGVSREAFLALIDSVGYSREAVGIEPGDDSALRDDHSYAFSPVHR